MNMISFRVVKASRSLSSQCKCFKTDAANFFNAKLPTDIPISQINEEKQVFQDTRQYIDSAIRSNEILIQQPEVCAWVQKVFDYNTFGNYKLRGLTTVFAYKLLEKPQNITEEKLKLIRIIGWSIEMLQAYLIILDDIMDNSPNRRNQPCWNRIPEVGLGALNDSTLLYCVLYDVLKKYFENTKYYPALSHVFNMFLLYAAVGQHLDMKNVYKGGNDYTFLTFEQYDSKVKNKTCTPFFEFPIIAAWFLIEDKETLPIREINKINREMGKIYQAQNDVLDCYGDEKFGKLGTDIQEGRCTWLAVQAYQRSDQRQRTVFENHFGRQEPTHVERVKLLYDELHLLDLFKEEEDKVFKRILKQIHALPKSISPSIFYLYFDIYEQKSLALKPKSFKTI